ncbi:hypothetical protein HDV00_002578 [Rhizophlyctis rosea]|nr:hypothetical protein HDV00_002578 [Rhizophlyctis rosea]
MSYSDLKLKENQAASLSEHRANLIQQLESALEMLEYHRAAAFEERIMDFGRALNKIWYFSATEAARMVQEQCMECNRTLLEDRENEVKYCAAVQATSIELDRRVDKTFRDTTDQWRTMRMSYILGHMRKECETIADGEIQKLYDDFQAQFTAHVEEQNGVIRNLSKSSTPLTMSQLGAWRSQTLSVIHKQEVAVQDFRNDLANVEMEIGRRLDRMMDVWEDKLEECRRDERGAQEQRDQDEPSSRDVIEAETQPYRNNPQILAGKRAGLLLASQAAQNRDILTLIADFIQCVLEIEQDYKLRTQELTADIHAKLEEVHALYVSDYKYQEKLLYREVEEMKREREDDAVTLRMDKCREILVAIGGLHRGFHGKAVGVMHNLSTQLKSSREAHNQMVLDTMQITAAPAFDQNHAKGPRSFIGTHGIRYLVPTFSSDVEFMTQLVQKWKEEKQERAQLAAGGALGVGKKDGKRKVAVREGGRAAFTRPIERKGTDVEIGGTTRFTGVEISNAPAGGRASLSLPSAPGGDAASPAPEQQVVEIPHLSQSCVREARINFQEVFVIHTERLMDAMARESDDTITEKIAEFGNDLSETLFALETRTTEIEEFFRKRLSDLAQTRQTNETFSRIFIYRLSTLKTAYSSAISQIELLSSTFASTHTLTTATRLRTCRTTGHIKLLHAQYLKHLSHHTATLNRHLNVAKEKFEKGKRELVASKNGPNRDAWELVKAVNGGKTDGVSELDRWAGQFEGRLDGVHEDLRGDVERLSVEVEAHLEDVGLIEAVERIIAGMRMRVKAETTKCESIKRDLKAELASLEAFRDYDTLRWDRIQSLITKTEKLRESVAAYAHYLGCVKEDQKARFAQQRPHMNFEQWKQEQSQATPEKKPAAHPASGKTATIKRPKTAPKKTQATPDAGSQQSLSFLALLEKAKVEVRANIVETCETFYKEKAGRTIRRSNEIPASASLYMGYTDIRLSHIQEKAEAFRQDRIEEFTTLLSQITTSTTTLTTKSLTILTTDAQRHLSTSWKSLTSSFSHSLLAAKSVRDAYCADNLKVSLCYTHDPAAELERVDKKGRQLESEVVRVGEEVQRKWREVVEREVKDVMERVEFVVEGVAGVVDGLVLGGDVERAQKMIETKQRTVRDVLEEMRAQTDVPNPTGSRHDIAKPAGDSKTTSESATTTYAALPISALPFPPSFQARPRTHRTTPLHAQIYADRDAKFLSFASDANHRWTTLQQYMDNEKAEDERWLAEWERVVEGIRVLRSRLVGGV